jgi:DNA (cytosine-5)-methyltransferase 1
MKKIKVGSDFSGVGAFDQALKKLGIDYQTIYACDWDKYARETFIHNYGEPEYYPKDVYEREIPSESLDIYMTSPPCQSFSLAGKRLGKDDKRGVLFFNSHEFIQVNKPRYFIFENVKGLLSDDNGKTFSEWVAMLGGKSVNGNPVLFPYEYSVPYHLYWKVLNAKEHGIPQNRERVFLVGIRDDQDNNFRFPIEEHLTKRLKDVLEISVDDKYFLSELAIKKCIKSEANKNMLNEEIPDKSRCIVAGYYKIPFDAQYIKIKSATSTGIEIATEGDSINFSQMNSKTRRGRVGDQVAQTLDTACNQGIMVGDYRSDEGFRWRKDQNSPCLTASMRDCKEWNEKFGTRCSPLIKYNDKRLNETIAKNTLKEGEIKILDTYNKSVHDNAPTLTEPHHNTTRLWDGFKIRRLTPRECFRLMDFPDSFTWPVSDSQAYKQAGNSIVVNVLVKIINKLNL